MVRVGKKIAPRIAEPDWSQAESGTLMRWLQGGELGVFGRKCNRLHAYNPDWSKLMGWPEAILWPEYFGNGKELIADFLG